MLISAAFNFGMNGINRRAFISLDAVESPTVKIFCFHIPTNHFIPGG